MVLDSLLNALTLYRGERITLEYPALACARVYRYRFIAQNAGQLRGYPTHGVVVLTENDAAVLQPGLALRAVIRQKVFHGPKLRISGFRSRQLFYDDPQAADLHRCQVRHGFREKPCVLFLFGNISVQKPFGGGASRRKARTYPLEQKRSHETGALFAFLQGGREILRGVIGKVEGGVGAQSQAVKPDPRICRAGIRVGVDSHCRWLQQAGLFQRLAAPQYGVPEDGIVFPVETRGQGPQQDLPLEVSKRTESLVREERIVGDAELKAQAREAWILTAWRQRIAQPFPRRTLIRGTFAASYHREGTAPVGPIAECPA